MTIEASVVTVVYLGDDFFLGGGGWGSLAPIAPRITPLIGAHRE